MRITCLVTVCALFSAVSVAEVVRPNRKPRLRVRRTDTEPQVSPQETERKVLSYLDLYLPRVHSQPHVNVVKMNKPLVSASPRYSTVNARRFKRDRTKRTPRRAKSPIGRSYDLDDNVIEPIVPPFPEEVEKGAIRIEPIGRLVSKKGVLESIADLVKRMVDPPKGKTGPLIGPLYFPGVGDKVYVRLLEPVQDGSNLILRLVTREPIPDLDLESLISSDHKPEQILDWDDHHLFLPSDNLPPSFHSSVDLHIDPSVLTSPLNSPIHFKRIEVRNSLNDRKAVIKSVGPDTKENWRRLSVQANRRRYSESRGMRRFPEEGRRPMMNNYNKNMIPSSFKTQGYAENGKASGIQHHRGPTNAFQDPSYHRYYRNYYQADVKPQIELTATGRNALRMEDKHKENVTASTYRPIIRISRLIPAGNEERRVKNEEKNRNYHREERKPNYHGKERRMNYRVEERKSSSYNSEERKPNYYGEERRTNYHNVERKPNYHSEERRTNYRNDERRSNSNSSEERKPNYRSEERRTNYPNEERKPSYHSEERRTNYHNEERRPNSNNSDERKPNYHSEERRTNYHNEKRKSNYYSEERRTNYHNEERKSNSYNSEEGLSSYHSEEWKPKYHDEERKTRYHSEEQKSNPYENEERERNSHQQEEITADPLRVIPSPNLSPTPKLYASKGYYYSSSIVKNVSPAASKHYEKPHWNYGESDRPETTDNLNPPKMVTDVTESWIPLKEPPKKLNRELSRNTRFSKGAENSTKNEMKNKMKNDTKTLSHINTKTIGSETKSTTEDNNVSKNHDYSKCDKSNTSSVEDCDYDSDYEEETTTATNLTKSELISAASENSTFNDWTRRLTTESTNHTEKIR